MRGLRKELHTHVIQSGATSLADLISAARVGEIAAGKRSSPTTSSDGLLGQLLQEMSASRRVSEQNAAELLQRLTSRLASSTTVNTVDAPSLPSRSSSPRRVIFRDTFGDDNMYTCQRTSAPAQQHGIRGSRPPYQYTADSQRRATPPPPFRGPPTRGISPRPLAQNARLAGPIHTCGNCGGSHKFGNRYCRAYGVACYTCGGLNQLSRMCRRGRRPSQGALRISSRGRLGETRRNRSGIIRVKYTRIQNTTDLQAI